jgi:hypothetical protein
MEIPSAAARAFMTPLSGGDLFDPGQTFPREELLRRILSVFWRNCCGVPGLARAPAPIIELRGENVTEEGISSVRAWWVMYDGIIEESEGPQSERIALFFGRGEQRGQLWPRYEFRVLENPMAVELTFHQDPGLRWGSRVHFETCGDGKLRVSGEESP